MKKLLLATIVTSVVGCATDQAPISRSDTDSITGASTTESMVPAGLFSKEQIEAMVPVLFLSHDGRPVDGTLSEVGFLRYGNGHNVFSHKAWYNRIKGRAEEQAKMFGYEMPCQFTVGHVSCLADRRELDGPLTKIDVQINEDGLYDVEWSNEIVRDDLPYVDGKPQTSKKHGEFDGLAVTYLLFSSDDRRPADGCLQELRFVKNKDAYDVTVHTFPAWELGATETVASNAKCTFSSSIIKCSFLYVPLFEPAVGGTGPKPELSSLEIPMEIHLVLDGDGTYKASFYTPTNGKSVRFLSGLRIY